MGQDVATGELSGYFEAREPGRRARADAWSTAIGLQQVDGLSTSPYLVQTAKDHIEGRISQEQARQRVHDYYAALRGTPKKSGQKKRSEKAVRKPAVEPCSSAHGGKTVERLLGLLKAEPSLTQAEMVERLGLASRSTVQKHLAALKAQGRVRRIGSDRSGHWVVV